MSGETSTSKICSICNINNSKYNCPRCGVFYCSLECYKSENHSQCSESFYQECVTNELMGPGGTNQGKYKMMDILTKLHKEAEEFDDSESFIEDIPGPDAPEDSDDEEDCLDLADRLNNIDLDNAEAVWSALTDDERKEFEALVANGDIGNLLPSWTPWWVHKKKIALVETIEDGNATVEDGGYLDGCPPLLKNISDFTSLTKITPSEFVNYNLVNLLAAYVYIARYFNGDHLSYEGAECLVNICQNLKSGTIFHDVNTAIESVIQECINSPLIASNKDNIKVMKQDIKCLFAGPEPSKRALYINSALSDLHCMFRKAKTESKTMEMKKSTSQAKSVNSKDFSRKFPEHNWKEVQQMQPSNTIESHIKKMKFYLAYMKTHGVLFFTLCEGILNMI